ncbi:MAG: hypothetical protein WCU74_01505 [Candidatus Omnitrophota bacterium]|jgi:hypothetical protein
MVNSLSIFNSDKFPKAAFVAFVLSILTALLIIFLPFISSSYDAALMDKVALAERTTSPRILFVGGSNLPFGINTDEINQFSNIPAINLGFRATVGLNFILSQIGSAMRRGDILVLVLEYELFDSAYVNGDLELAYAVVAWPGSMRFVRYPGQYATLLRYLPAALKNRMREIYRVYFENRGGKEISSVYRRSAFNAFGDIQSRLVLTHQVVDYSAQLPLQVGDRPFTILRQFLLRAESQGVKVMLMFPAVPEQLYERHRKEISVIHRRLLDMPAVLVIGEPSDFVYPESYFYDTVYHLNAKGRKLRTRKTIDLLSGASIFKK